MMNLYILNETCPAAIYGIGTYTRELNTALKDSDINVCVVNLMSDKSQIDTENIGGIRHWHFPAPITGKQLTNYQDQGELYYRNIVYLLQLYIKKSEKNLVFHLNYQSDKLAKELKKTFDCKIVSVVHYSNWGLAIYDNLTQLRSILNERHSDSFGKNLKKLIEEEKEYYSNVDYIICLSSYIKEILCRDYGIVATKISVIPNGLNDEADIFNVDVDFLRKKWHIQAKEKIIVFAGRVTKAKGLSYLIEAFRDVLIQYPNCHLIIAGSGDYDTYLHEAKDICMKITFTGLLEKKHLYEIYQIAEVGVVPSLFEQFGYVAVEMMMHELPIVATVTSGLNEVIDETCGIKIPLVKYPDRVEIDSSLLSEKIIYLFQHPEEAHKMGKNGRHRYLEKYSSPVFRKNMIEFYHHSLIDDSAHEKK